MRVVDDPPPTKATTGGNGCAGHRALRRAHRLGPRDRGARQPGQGRVGPGDPERQPAARPARGRRPQPRSGCGHERSTGARSGVRGRAGWRLAGSSRTGEPDLAIVTTADRARGAGRGRVHARTSRPRRRCRSAARTSQTGAPRRSSSAPATRTRRPGSRAAPTRRRMAELTGDGLGCDADGRARVLDRAHRLLHADGRARVRHPEAHRVARTAPTPRPTRSSPPTPCARRPSRRSAGTARGRRRHGQGRGDARARRWPRCSRSSPPTRRSTPDRSRPRSPTAVDDTFNQLCVDACTSTNDTVLVLANGASGVAIGDDRSLGGVHRCAHRGVRVARRADGPRRRGRDQVRPGHRARRPFGRRGPPRPRARSPRRSWSSAR